MREGERRGRKERKGGRMKNIHTKNRERKQKKYKLIIDT